MLNYVFEVVSQCPHGSAPFDISGNAMDVNSLVLTCSVCHKAAHVNSAQEVGLDPSDPGFEARLDELTDGFSTLSYYLGTVANGQLRLEIRLRKQIRVDFAIFCKTCNKQIEVDATLRETLKQHHKDHDIKIGPVGDAPIVGKLLEQFHHAMEQLLGEKINLEEPEEKEKA